MLIKELKFVEHSVGVFEGRSYDKVVLSDGIAAVSFKNKTGLTKMDFQRGDNVRCEFEVNFTRKGTVDLVLVSIS